MADMFQHTPLNSQAKTAFSVPERMPLHYAYFLLFGASMLSALWQHAHPGLTIVLVLSLIPAAFISYIPLRILPREFRTYLQIAVITVAIVWAVIRLFHKVPTDKLLIEMICILGMSLAFSMRAAEYGYMLLISVLLLVYGALLPRTMYLMILLPAFFLLMAIVYKSRLNALSGEGPNQIFRSSIRKNWLPILIHMCILVPLWIYFYSILPTERKTGRGIFVVSFSNDNDLYVPPQFANWLTSEKIKLSGEQPGDSNRFVPGLRAEGQSKSGPPVSSSGEKASSMDSSGSGSGAPGDEMVFRAKSPVKFYWVGNIYDFYDGVAWKQSPSFKKQHLKWDLAVQRFTKRVEQNIVIEKWISPVLFAGYRASYYSINFPLYAATNRSFYNERLTEKQPYPKLPFTYTVTSELMNVESLGKMKKPVSLWGETLSRTHYLKLPGKRISERLKNLSKRLSSHLSGDYERALAIRDYLRTNFVYKQFSSKTPKDRESVDYFIFDLKMGHCEYFASSMCVLARLSGLPARVVTGFSPGNYNALNGLFEVHEYHAHAWTQVFCDKKGWLTIDPTPPGEIVSRTTPIGIGSLHDPFGDEWKVTPPELTESTLNSLKSDDVDDVFSSPERAAVNPAPSLLSKIFMSMAMAPEKIGSALDKAREDLSGGKPKGKDTFSFKDIFTSVKSNLMLIAQKIASGWKSFMKWFFSTSGSIFLIMIMTAALFSIKTPGIYRKIKNRLTIRRCVKRLADLEKLKKTSPCENVKLCYNITRKALDAAGWPRLKNMELFDYGATLNKVNHAFCNNVLVIYYIYSKAIYSSDPPTVQDAETVLERTRSITSFILSYTKENKKPTHSSLLK
ncbi:MAG: hypothetical protein A2020_07540 [Lentisphaerae bacterium GWF2_45_14]|nr:MAG: hypothetical protein A2020_07540 [Lentisphaerae bacterium GWF2_45_14]